MPSSCSLGSNATTRYELRAFASSLLEGNIDIRSEKMEVQVVERWAEWREGPWQKGSERKAAEKLAMGGDGQLELTVQLGMGDWAEKPARLFWRGDHDMEVSGKTKIEVNARVRNMSKRHVRRQLVAPMMRLLTSSVVGHRLQAFASSPPAHPVSRGNASPRRTSRRLDRHRNGALSRHRLRRAKPRRASCRPWNVGPA